MVQAEVLRTWKDAWKECHCHLEPCHVQSCLCCFFQCFPVCVVLNIHVINSTPPKKIIRTVSYHYLVRRLLSYLLGVAVHLKHQQRFTSALQGCAGPEVNMYATLYKKISVSRYAIPRFRGGQHLQACTVDGQLGEPQSFHFYICSCVFHIFHYNGIQWLPTSPDADRVLPRWKQFQWLPLASQWFPRRPWPGLWGWNLCNS